ncbi:MAG: S9 family peptidase [Chthonomonas sp.]|nr:S9 family peptidase [Chthonomonas sp.]
MSRPLEFDDILRIKSISHVAVSPDGKQVVAALKSVATPSTYQTNLVDWSNGRPKRLTKGRVSDGQPQFSADGRLFFGSNRNKPKPAVFTLKDGKPELVFEMPEGSIGAMKVSPDGNKFAFLYRPADPHATKAAKAERKRAKTSEPPLAFSQFPWRLDGDGEFGDRTWHLMVWSGGKAEPLGVSDCWAGIDFAWLPDSSGLVVAHDPRTEPFMEYSADILELFPLKGERRVLNSGNGGKSMVSVSPSGELVAYVLDPSEPHHWGIRRQQLGVVNLKTGAHRLVMADQDLLFSGHPLGDARDASNPQILWLDEDRVAIPWSERGDYALAEVNLATETATKIAHITGEVHVTAHHKGQFWGWICTPESPTEMVTIKGGKIKLLAPVNRDWLKDCEVARLEELHVPVPGSYDLHAWRIRAVGASKGKRPAVISVHGGPACFYSPTFFFEMQMFAAHGFEVFLSNPRGSTSYGEEHARCILGEWGQQDWADVKALTDHAKADPEVDTDRVSIVGGSYGGYMVNWAIAHDPTYHRAVSDRCVSNLLSKWGNSDYPFVPDGVWPGCAFRDDIDVLWECSPIKHMGNAKTPTLIIHSVGDLRCHIEQGEQVFTALKMLGVRTRMVRYPVTTSHGLSRNGPPDLRIHRLQEYVAWLKS